MLWTPGRFADEGWRLRKDGRFVLGIGYHHRAPRLHWQARRVCQSNAGYDGEKAE